MKLAIKSKKLISPLKEIKDAVILINGERIEAVGRQVNIQIPDDYKVKDVGDRMVAPGLVDIHNHGANGYFAREGEQAVQEVSKYLARTGTTTWLATIGDAEGVRGGVKAIRNGTKGCYVPGIRCEGPFLYPKYLPGESKAPPPPADEKTFMEMYEAGEGYIKIMDCSPDLPGGLEMIKRIRRHGIISAFAHGNAGYKLFMQAVECGVSISTHTYNVMVGMHHRRPGAVGAALTCDEVMAELTGDGVHVHPVAMDVLIRCKGLDRVVLISDSQAIAGLPDGFYDWSDRIIDGEYNWVGVKLMKKDGVARLAESDEQLDGAISSSVYQLKKGIQNLVFDVGVKLKDAFRMGSLNPAIAAGLDGELGSLRPGKRADLIVIDDEINLFMTMVGGKIVHETEVVSELVY
ncbi:MAG: amidohydrolase family protein [Saprospiraceae bacterium]|nr:amidohydrolase family protein [Saprospiraceae bacterium]